MTFLGHVDRSELADRLAVGAIHVVPSAWEEPYGRSAAEALMRGQALVASAVGGLGELATASGAAVTVPPGDVTALADALLRLAAIRGDRETRARRAPVRLRELTIERFAERFLESYEQAGATDVA